jgi:hypothetical protein
VLGPDVYDFTPEEAKRLTEEDLRKLERYMLASAAVLSLLKGEVEREKHEERLYGEENVTPAETFSPEWAAVMASTLVLDSPEVENGTAH